MMLFVECELYLPSPLCLSECFPDGPGDGIGIQYNMGIDISCRSSDNLDQAPCIPEEPLLVGIKDPDKTDFRNVKTFPEQVNSYQDIEFPEPSAHG